MRFALAFARTALLGCVATVVSASAQSRPAAFDRAWAEDLVRAALHSAGPDARASVWIGKARGKPLFAWRANQPEPAASSIKTAILVELFAARSDALDEPLPGVGDLLGDDKHAAIAHFGPATRDAIRSALIPATVRRIGEMMISGKGVSNAIYNAATNLAIAYLGGPKALTARIHRRDPSFVGLTVRRYMLARRDVNGDNEASAAGLASVLRRIALRDVPRVSSTVHDALRATLRRDARRVPGSHFFKGGSLDSDPPCRVRSGFREHEGETIVYAVMVSRPRRVPDTKSILGHRLPGAVRWLTEALVQEVRRASGRVLFTGRYGFRPTPADAPALEGTLCGPADASSAHVPVAAVSPLPGQVVGDIGCGSGGVSVLLAKRVGPAGRVFCRDVSARGIASLRKRPAVADLGNFDIARSEHTRVGIAPKTLDHALLSEVFDLIQVGHGRLQDKNAFLRSLRDAMKPGGIVTLVDWVRTDADAAESLKSTVADFQRNGFEAGRRYKLRRQRRGTHFAVVLEFRRPHRG